MRDRFPRELLVFYDYILFAVSSVSDTARLGHWIARALQYVELRGAVISFSVSGA